MFNSSSDISSLQPSNLDEYKDKSDRSKLNDLIRTYQTTRKKDDGVRKEGSAFPDSNRDECVGIRKSPKDLITTNFAGYVLQFPCTINQKGSYSKEFAEDGSITKQKYTLFFSAVLEDQSENIWPDGKISEPGSKDSYFMKLHSEGNFVSFAHVDEKIEKAQKIKTENGFTVYQDKSDVIVVPENTSSNIGEFPHLICDRYGDVDAAVLFSPVHDIGKKSQCYIFWRLDNSIKVTLIRVKSEKAYDFMNIYERITHGLQKTIVKRPQLKHRK